MPGTDPHGLWAYEQAIKAGEAIGEIKGRMVGFETRMTGLEERIDKQFSVLASKMDLHASKLDDLAKTDNEQKGGLKFATTTWFFISGILAVILSISLNWALGKLG